MATVARVSPDVTVLEKVPYEVYVRLRDAEENRHLRMAYHDGTLEIVSPRLRKHEKPSRRLSIVITTVADRFGLVYDGTGSYTYRRSGGGPHRGKGKEPDQSFYFANTGRLPKDRDPDLDAGDPPPDLWVEVDNRASSKGRLPVYAALGVPEVWRHRSSKKSLQFHQLIGGRYVPVDRSISIPALTPSLVLETLALGDDLVESDWVLRLREWVVRTFPI